MTHEERRERAQAQVADLEERLRRARLQRSDRLRLGLTVGHDIESRIPRARAGARGMAADGNGRLTRRTPAGGAPRPARS